MFNKLKIVKQIVSLPKVKIDIIDTDKTGEINELYKYFTKPHPKYKIFKNKTLGVMLFEIPKNLDDYEKQITGKNSVKYFSKRCLKLGYYTDYFIKNEHLDEMYEINTSAKYRQGRTMSSHYLEKVPEEDEKDCVSYFGVFTSSNKLVGYIKLVKTQKLYIISQILGHHDYQNDHIMYLIIHDLIVSLIDENSNKDYLVYLMYDTFFGGTDGIKLYKKRHQFKPYKVKWKYIDER